MANLKAPALSILRENPIKDICMDGGVSCSYTNSTTISDHGFTISGEGEQTRASCGKVGWRGCLNKRHPNHKGKNFIKSYRTSCYMRSCSNPVCKKNYCQREARKAQRRIRAFKPDQYRAPIHVIISVPVSLYGVDAKDLRRMAYKHLKRVGCYAGLLVFHPSRRKISKNGYSPHFHSLGYGWIHGGKVADLYKSEGWIIKNLGIRKDIGRVVNYLASHAGVKQGFNSISWYGELGYNKLKVEKEDKKISVCAYCGESLFKLESYGDQFPPYDGLTDWDNMEIIPSSYSGGSSGVDADSLIGLWTSNYI